MNPKTNFKPRSAKFFLKTGLHKISSHGPELQLVPTTTAKQKNIPIMETCLDRMPCQASKLNPFLILKKSPRWLKANPKVWTAQKNVLTKPEIHTGPHKHRHTRTQTHCGDPQGQTALKVNLNLILNKPLGPLRMV